MHTEAATSALGTSVSLQVGGNAGTTQLSFAAGTHLSSVAFAINQVKGVTGVSAVASGKAPQIRRDRLRVRPVRQRRVDHQHRLHHHRRHQR